MHIFDCSEGPLLAVMIHNFWKAFLIDSLNWPVGAANDICFGWIFLIIGIFAGRITIEYILTLDQLLPNVWTLRVAWSQINIDKTPYPTIFMICVLSKRNLCEMSGQKSLSLLCLSCTIWHLMLWINSCFCYLCHHLDCKPVRDLHSTECILVILTRIKTD